MEEPNSELPSVLFINRVYPPSVGASGQLLKELAVGLASAGCRVTVLTGGTNLEEADLGSDDRITVQRIRMIDVPTSSHFMRAVAHLLMYPLFVARALRLSRHDILVTLTDPPLLSFLGVLLKSVKKTNTIQWEQDIYPEVAVELGVIKRNGVLAVVLMRLSTWCLKRYDHVVVVGRCMAARIRERGINSQDISIIPNWSLQDIKPVSEAVSAFRRKNELTDRFVVMYSGNMGLAHDFEPILRAAQLLQNRLTSLLFLFVGDGPRKVKIEQFVVENGLKNISFLPFQPLETLSESLSSADLHIASLREDLLGLVVPSKVYGAFAVGCPCIFLGPSDCEISSVIRQEGCGDVLPFSTGENLANCLEEWFKDHEKRQVSGTRALNYSSRTRTTSLDNWMDLIRHQSQLSRQKSD